MVKYMRALLSIRTGRFVDQTSTSACLRTFINRNLNARLHGYLVLHKKIPFQPHRVTAHWVVQTLDVDYTRSRDYWYLMILYKIMIYEQLFAIPFDCNTSDNLNKIIIKRILLLCSLSFYSKLTKYCFLNKLPSYPAKWRWIERNLPIPLAEMKRIKHIGPLSSVSVGLK